MFLAMTGKTASRSAALGLAIVLAAGLALWGGPVWFLPAASGLAWVMVLRFRFGVAFAIAVTFVGCLWVLLIIMVITAFVGAPLLLTVVCVLAAAGIVACALWGRHAQPRRLTDRSNFLALVPAALGAIVWLAISITNAVVRPISGLSSVMHGDAASYLLYARSITRAGGIVLGPDENPVPLPAALFALFMAPGRAGASPSGLLRHDLFAYESLQIVVITITCLLAGLLAGGIARRANGSVLLAGASAAGGSLLPLSWLLTTNPLIYGYFDAELGIPVVFAAITLALGARERPVAAASALALVSTVLLVVWSPLVVVSIGLLVSIIVRERMSLLRQRGWRRAALIASAVQLLSWGLAVTLPGLLSQARFLSTFGAIYSFTHSLFPSIALVVVALAILALRVGRAPVGVVGIIVPASLGIGLAVLLYASRGAQGGWSYFPTKFEWVSVAVLVVLMLGFLPSAVLPWITRRSVQWIAVVSIFSMAAIVMSSAPEGGSQQDKLNLFSWLGQSHPPVQGWTASAAIILAAGNPAHPTLYWQSALPDERYLNYWFIELEARTMGNNALRKFAFSYDESRVSDLCTILTRTPGRTTIHTRDSSLASRLASQCDSVSPRIIVTNR